MITTRPATEAESIARIYNQGRRLGHDKMVLAGCPANPAGVRLYEKQGFRTVGVYQEQGMLDGAWVDVIVMEKILR